MNDHIAELENQLQQFEQQLSNAEEYTVLLQQSAAMQGARLAGDLNTIERVNLAQNLELGVNTAEMRRQPPSVQATMITQAVYEQNKSTELNDALIELQTKKSNDLSL